MADEVPRIPLRVGDEIPQIGFGVFQVPPEQTTEAVTQALLTGYRLLDTAAAYHNEAEVGQAVHAAGLARREVFITTKCPSAQQGHEEARRAFDASLAHLDTDYVDLYLIHWPAPARDRYVQTWKAFIELRAEDLIRSIGVSNFQSAHLERLIAETGETPAINQIELHPYFQQVGLRREHEALGIVTEAWSPLARGLVLEDSTIVRIARAHARTPAQIVIRWHVQLGNVVIPRSVAPERIRQNFEVFDFELSEDEMRQIDALDAGRRIGPDPDTFAGV
jgi:2,5-diketo-D-gluconate reductase A